MNGVVWKIVGMVTGLRLLYLYVLRPVGAFPVRSTRLKSPFLGFEPPLVRCNRQGYLFGTRFMTTSSGQNEKMDSSAWSTGIGQEEIGRETISQVQKEDSLSELDVLKDVVDDENQTLKIWRKHLEVSIARSRKIRGSNYVQLATMDSQLTEPRCRTVVFRGFLSLPEDHSLHLASVTDRGQENLKLPCIMKMCTDGRSEKVNQTGPSEIVWWFPKSSEQYRIRGEMLLVGSDDAPSFDRHLLLARKEMWGSLTDASRESFLTLARPGDVFEPPDSDPKNRLMGGRDADGKVIQPPPDTFLLLLLVPKRCDYLNLTTMYRQIDKIVNGQWQSQRVNP